MQSDFKSINVFLVLQISLFSHWLSIVMASTQQSFAINRGVGIQCLAIFIIVCVCLLEIAHNTKQSFYLQINSLVPFFHWIPNLDDKQIF